MTETEWAVSTNPSTMLGSLRGRAADRKLRLFNCACCRRVWHLLGSGGSRAAVEAGEMFADGLLPVAELHHAADAAEEAAEALEPERDDPSGWSVGKSIRSRAADPAKAARAAWLAAWDGSRSPTFDPAEDPRLAVLDAAADCVAAAGWHAAGGEAATQEVARETSIDAKWEAVSLLVTARNAGREAEAAAQAAVLRCVFGNPFRAVTTDPSWRTDTVLLLAEGMYESRDFSPMPVLADALQDAGCEDDGVLTHCRADGPHARGCWVVDLILEKGRTS